METTHSKTQETTYTQTSSPKISNEGMISKKALIGFVCCAAIVFGVAITYCFNTGHAGVGGFLCGAVVFIAIYAATTYKSFK